MSFFAQRGVQRFSRTPFQAHRMGWAQQQQSLIRMMNTRGFASRVLILADHNNEKLGASTLHAATAVSQLSPESTHILVAGGSNIRGVAEEASKIPNVNSVFAAAHPAFEHQLAENIAGLLQSLQKEHGFTHIVGSTSAQAKDALPRAAAGLDVQPITDVIGVQGEDTFVRPIYAGNAVSTVKSKDSLKIITVRPTAFSAASIGESQSEIVDVPAAADADAGLSSFVRDELSASDRPELASAPVVVSGGRGMKSGENFKMLEELADILGGAIGASRAAVDAGFVPNELQVGQTGKVVAPDLYFAVGISGAIQHLAGMKDSKTIVAINKDPEAPIFQVADYGVVGDLFKVVPELNEKLQVIKQK